MTAGPVMSHRSAGREIAAEVRRLAPPSGEAQTPDYRPRHLPEDTNALPLIAGDDSVRVSHLGYVAENYHARELGDILFARTGLGYRHRLTEEDIRKAAEAVSAHLGWDAAEVSRQVDAVCARMTSIYQPTAAVD